MAVTIQLLEAFKGPILLMPASPPTSFTSPLPAHPSRPRLRLTTSFAFTFSPLWITSKYLISYSNLVSSFLVGSLSARSSIVSSDYILARSSLSLVPELQSGLIISAKTKEGWWTGRQSRSHMNLVKVGWMSRANLWQGQWKSNTEKFSVKIKRRAGTWN